MHTQLNKFFLILLMHSIICASDQKDSHTYDLGRSITRGALDEFSEKLQNFMPLENATKFINTILKNFFSGASDALQDKEFDGLTKSFGGAAQKSIVASAQGVADGVEQSTGILTDSFGKVIKNFMRSGAHDLDSAVDENLVIFDGTVDKASRKVGQSMHKAADNFGEELADTFKQGSKVDIGAQEAIAFGTRNLQIGANDVNKAIHTLIHKNLMKGGAIFITTAVSYCIAAYGIPLGFRMLEKSLTTPKLIIASSKKGFFEWLFGYGSQLTPMIFTPKLEQRLNEIVQVTKTVHAKIKEGKTNIKYRNLMLYGPPGTGKTLFATELAKRSGLEYVFMSGSSFSKFKDGEAIEALDHLFAWANKTTGLMIFIDEAETFLSKRENLDPQSQAYLLLNNFLNYTGTRSNKFMIVFATNYKDTLDSAMYRRIDDLVEIPLPGKKERMRMLELYKNSILMDKYQNEDSLVKSVHCVMNNQTIERMAELTKGLSGGDIEGIVNNIKTSTDILNPAVVTNELIDKIVAQAVAKHLTFTGGVYLGAVED